MIQAEFVKSLEGWMGDVQLYKLSAPIPYSNDLLEDAEPGETDHVVVSAVIGVLGAETYIFPADSEGGILSWSELPGSYRGTLSHERAIHEAGWELTS